MKKVKDDQLEEITGGTGNREVSQADDGIASEQVFRSDEEAKATAAADAAGAAARAAGNRGSR